MNVPVSPFMRPTLRSARDWVGIQDLPREGPNNCLHCAPIVAVINLHVRMNILLYYEARSAAVDSDVQAEATARSRGICAWTPRWTDAHRHRPHTYIVFVMKNVYEAFARTTFSRFEFEDAWNDPMWRASDIASFLPAHKALRVCAKHPEFDKGELSNHEYGFDAEGEIVCPCDDDHVFNIAILY